MKNINFEPYTYKITKGFLFYGGFVEVLYDDTVIHIAANVTSAKHMVAKLNGAYNEGYRHAVLDQEFKGTYYDNKRN